jgi:hypothetical protein
MPHWRTDHNKFYNPIAMFAYAAENTPNIRPIFDVFDSEFTKVDWTKEPEESFQTLLEKRAIQLREKYDYLVLSFSGGSDSLTIYNVFKKLKLRLDEILISYHTDTTFGHPISMVNWIKKDITDPSIKITTVCRDVNPLFFESALEDFLLDRMIGYNGHGFNSSQEHAKIMTTSSLFANNKAAIIQGMEKPRILRNNGRWYATHLDKIFKSAIPRVAEWFYITPNLPELSIKQAHLLKNNVKKFINPQTDFVVSEFYQSSFSNMELVERWCGRDNSIVDDDIRKQKLSLNGNQLNIISLVNPKYTELYTPPVKLIMPGNPLMNNFLNTLKTMQTDNTIINYMRRHNLLSDSAVSIDNWIGMYSHFHDLGE